MGKFGKKHTISLNPLDYNICLAGIGGIGKTTLAKEVAEKLVGEEGYIHFNIGLESGVDAIQNIISEDIEDWAKLEEVTDDIIENKASDYPELRVIIWDSLDELVNLAETETIRVYNRKNPDKKIDSILQAFGGFGKGNDYAINLVYEVIENLKKVGVHSFIIAHTKRSDITDAVTQQTYSQLTADVSQRYFNSIKNKMDIVGVGYIDRVIVKENLGRKNIVTKKEETINRVAEETRVICFRDQENYSVDSKSRFAQIEPKIPFDSDAFIKAIEEAIKVEASKSNKSFEDMKKEQEEKDADAENKATEFSKSAKLNKIDEEKNEELLDSIKKRYQSMKETEKADFKNLMKELGVESFKDASIIPTASLEKLSEF
jgi:DNA polymerase III delta prime subunit